MRKMRLVLAALAVAGLGVAAPAAPAAAVPNLVYASGFSAYDSAPEKAVTADCPGTTRVLGGGGYILSGGHQVHFNRLQALGSSDQFTAVAVERGAYAGSWRVYAYAICGTEPAGLEYVSYRTGSDSAAAKAATAPCTGTGQLISTGGRIVDGDGQVVLDQIQPLADLSGAYATAYEDQDGYAGDWSMYSYGVCATGLSGLELRTATGPNDSTDDTVSVSCTGSRRVHGVGGLLNGGLGEALFTAVYPSSDLTTATVNATEDADGLAGNWYTRVYAICAD